MTPAANGGGAGAGRSEAGTPAGKAGEVALGARDDQPTAGTPAAGSGGRIPQAGSGPAAGSGGSAPLMRATKFDAGSDPNRNKVGPADVCRRLSEIQCAGEAYCCEQPGRSVDACKAESLRACSQDLMLDKAAQNPITGFDAAAAERGFTEFETKAGICDPSVTTWASSPQGLRGLLKGTVAADASCKPAEALPAPSSIAASLLSCSEPNSRACLYTNPLDTWTCAPRAAAGGACLTDNNCLDGFYCVLPALAITGTCTERKATGDACSAATECKTLFCKQSKCVEADQQAAYCLTS